MAGASLLIKAVGIHFRKDPVVSGQRLTCLGFSLERHLRNLEEKRGGIGGMRERQNQDKALFKVQFYYFRHSVMKQGKGTESH